MTAEELAEIRARLDRIEHALVCLAWWSYQAGTGLGLTDVRAIEDIIKGAKGSSRNPTQSTLKEAQA